MSLNWKNELNITIDHSLLPMDVSDRLPPTPFTLPSLPLTVTHEIANQSRVFCS